jgi:lysophospholipase L1-like esterase
MTIEDLHRASRGLLRRSAAFAQRLLGREAGILALIVTVTLIASLGLGEIYLRLAYPDGLSFGAKNGPLVARFERDFRFNRYDGPSRGPEIIGAKPDSARILIQGDSVTWGQGVKEESSLYSSILRDRLRAIDPEIQVAVLARPGREIDGHLEQLRKWGAETDPDIIIYQWFINDLELDKSLRPSSDHTWRRLLFPGFLRQRSYLWYFLDYRIGTLMPEESYEVYLREHFGRGSAGWQRVAALFHAWAAEAKRLTPNVLVALHPYVLSSPDQPLREFSVWMEELCGEEGVAVIDLLQPFAVFRDDYTKTYASPFDSHPNAAAHALIADALHHRIVELWPQVLHPPLPSPATTTDTSDNPRPRTNAAAGSTLPRHRPALLRSGTPGRPGDARRKRWATRSSNRMPSGSGS